MASFGCLVQAVTPAKRQRCAHQLQKIAAIGGIVPIRRAVGEFVFDEGLELLGLGEFFEALPVQRSLGRFQPSPNLV